MPSPPRRPGLKPLVTVCLLGAMACAHATSMDRALRGIAPTTATSPQSPVDSVVAIVLARVATTGLPDLQPARRVILQAGPSISPRALPSLDSVSWFLADSIWIRQAVERHGPLGIVSVASRAQGDSVTVQVNSVRWFPARSHISLLSLSGCAWLYRRVDDAWTMVRDYGCFIT